MKRYKQKIKTSLQILLLVTTTLLILGIPGNTLVGESLGTRLTGIIYVYDDQGLDIDGDGFFDYLKVGVQVNATEPGIYRVSISGLYSSNSSYISIYGDKSMYLDVGLQVVNVSLYGPTIYLSGLNPVNVSSIYLYGADWNWLGSIHNVPLSREYSYTEFDAPGAHLTGVISDKGTDSDGDGLFNYLEVEVEINVTEAGYYRVSVSGLEDANFSYISVYDSQYLYLIEDVHMVNLTLRSLSIYTSGLNPAFVSYIYLEDEDYRNIGSLSRVALSREYAYTEFDPPKAVLTGTIYDWGLDLDDDDTFDYLQIGVEINVSDSGNYRVKVSGLQDSSFNHINVWGYVSGYFDLGVHVLNVSLYGPTIYGTGLNPMYVSSIYLYDDYYSYLYDVPLSREYLYTDFDLPGATFTSVISDYGVDTDGDGEFNYLEVGVEINVTEAGYYEVSVSRLLDVDDSYIYVYDSEYQYLYNGTQVVYLSLAGLQIHLSGRNPRYVNYIRLRDENYRHIGSLDGVPLSREYSYSEFEAPGAIFTSTIYDKGVDTDGDGFFNYLEVGVEVNVTEAGTYEVSVNGLRDAEENWISVYGSAREYLEVGIQVLNVSLSGLTIYLSKRNPNYISYASLRDQNYNQLDELSHMSLSREYSYSEFDPPGAVLTGDIFDQGVDTDADGTYDYLQIGVQVNVTDPGNYHVSVSGLLDSSFDWISVYDSNFTYLDAGLQIVYLYLEGPRIYLSGRNPRYIDYISLRDEKYTYYDHLNQVPLSREYSYTEFDTPAAMLTGNIYDRGVDTDGDGAFDYLEVGVEINVTKSGTYWVHVSALRDMHGGYMWVWGFESGYFGVGLGVLNVSLPGPSIYASRLNPRYIDYIGLSADYYSSIHDVPLSREYSYTEFDFSAILTGVIFDQGVDTDTDDSFDYLEVGVQVNVSDPGTYVVHVSGLRDANSRYISVWDSKTIYLNAGIQTVNLYLYGPQIYVTRRNPSKVSYISLTVKQDMPYYYYDTLYDTPLSREYSYSEFDAPFVDAEAKFVVYPDGRVTVEGALNYTHMVPKNTGPTAQGFFNLTSTQALADLMVNLPPEIANEFPYNSTTVDLLAKYSNGLLDLGINSTMILPPVLASQYPFNSTDANLTATYSGGILNIEVEGNTTLPGLVSQQFPFNATDITAIGTYSPNTLDGTITFSVLDGFTFDDVNVDFTGNQTDFTLNGTVYIVFNVPLGDFIIHDEAELIQKIDQLKSDLLGEEGIVWNMTGGLLNVTNLDIDYVLNHIGADITFEMEVHGDFLRALAYTMSGGRNEMLLYPVLNEAYQLVQSGSFDIRYSHTTLEASMKLTFSYDLKSLIDYVLTPPTGTTPYVMPSYSMSPTLWPGDVVMVEEVSNASDIVDDPETGDIIAFYSPYDRRYVVIHRAINKTYVNGTWYFTTKGDANYSPDHWSGNNTYNGMVSEQFLIGKLHSRIPLLGYLLPYSHMYYLYYYPYPGYPYYTYPQECVAPSLLIMKEMFNSVQDMSINMFYSSTQKQFDFRLTFVDKLKELRDAIVPLLPKTLPDTVPPEVRSFVESILNITYAEVSSAQVSLSYDNGIAHFSATVDIEGDLNAEINYVKDLYFQLMGAQSSRYDWTIPWQLDFINHTQVDLSNFKVSAQLGETSFEGRIEGLTLMPPIDAMNATYFKLERFFNLTAPQYPWQQEFPRQNQKLKITIEGGKNATHSVVLFRPPTVPEPNITAPDRSYMVWFNQTVSGIKDLVFEIHPLANGTLTVTTTPVAGEVFVNGESWGIAPQSRIVEIGTHTVSFGSVEGYNTPPNQVARVYKNQETVVEGVYTEITPITGTLTVKTEPVAGEVFVNGSSWGIAPKSRLVEVGTYIVTFGDLEGFYTPSGQTVTIHENVETTIKGVYEPVPGVVVEQITEPELVNATNPFTLDAIEDAATSLIISEISDPITIVVKNVTDPVGVEPPPGTWEVLGNYVQITVNNTDISVNATIRIYYTLEQLEASGLDESTLEIRYWNSTLGEWIPVESHVNTEERYVEAIIDHFSLWVIMGQPRAKLGLPLFWIVLIVVVIAVSTFLAFVLRKRAKKPLLTEDAVTHGLSKY